MSRGLLARCLQDDHCRITHIFYRPIKSAVSGILKICFTIGNDAIKEKFARIFCRNKKRFNESECELLCMTHWMINAPFAHLPSKP